MSIAPKHESGRLKPEADKFLNLMMEWRRVNAGKEAAKAFDAVVAYIDAWAEVLPEGLSRINGVLMYHCRSCDKPTEWPASLEDFDIENTNNQCGRSERCCP